MAAPLLVLTMGEPSALAARAEYAGVVADLDLYRLPDADLSGVRALLLGAHVDQVFLHAHRPLLDRFVAGGGRLAVCGQVVLPFVAGLCPFRPLDYRGVADLTVHRLAQHPVWDGVQPDDLTFRRGVAGFYGRGHYPDLPADALVVHGLGPARHPLDAVYPHGAGQVLVHGGNDLWGYAEDDTTAARMTPRLVEWALAGDGARPAGGPRIGLLHGGASYHLATLADPVVAEHVARPLYLPDLAGPAARAELDALDTLVVADRLHPDELRRHAGLLREVPARGGTLVVLGELEAHTWLPALRWSPRPTNFWWWRTGEDPGIRAQAPDHPIWAHLNTDDVIWHHHGLLHPPAGATALASVYEQGEPAGAILYDDRASTPGRLVVTTMDPVHHHGGNFMPAATRLLHGLLRWLAAGG